MIRLGAPRLFAVLVAAFLFAGRESDVLAQESALPSTADLVETVTNAFPEIAASLPDVPVEVVPAEPPGEANPLFAAYSRGKLEPPVAIDLNPDPAVVEVVLVAHPSVWEFQPGVPTTVWTYNGTIPGPTIEAKTGDRVIAHFLNLLPEDTTIHWHGVEVPAAMDGSHVSQETIPPGGTFTYEFDLLAPALYWYHPHHRSNVQVENGLYAALLVHGDDEVLGLPAETRETILVLDDVVLHPVTGQIIDEFPPASNPTARATVMSNGKEDLTDPVLLINGKVGRRLQVENGVPQRLRMVNSANSRFMRMSIPGATMHLVGGDAGLLPGSEARTEIERLDYRDSRHPCHNPDNPTRPLSPCAHAFDILSDAEIDRGVLLTPGERADVVWTPSGSHGEIVPFEWHDWPRGRHTFMVWGDRIVAGQHQHGPNVSTLPDNFPEEMGTFQILGSTGGSGDYSPPPTLRTIAPVVARNTDGSLPAGVRRLPVEYGHTHHPDGDGNLTFWVQTEEAGADGCAAGRIPVMGAPDANADGHPDRCGIPFGVFGPGDAYDLAVGDTVIWEVVGTAHADHNFHTHGFFFQPLEYEYVVTDLDGTEVSRTIQRLDCGEHIEPGEACPTPQVVENKDSILIPKALAPNLRSHTIFRAATRIDDTGREGQVLASGGIGGNGTSGGWMFHCHILEHAARGMMAYFEVME